MKFLTISKLRDSAGLCPLPAMRQMMEATVAWMDGQKKAGKILEAYAIPGDRVAVICEHPDAEDAAKTVASIPVGVFMEHEVYVLADLDAVMKVDIENMKQAEQRMK